MRGGRAQLPAEKDYGFQRWSDKIRQLNAYLKEKGKGLRLDQALRVSEKEAANLLSGYSYPSRHVMDKASVYFSLPNDLLTDDSKDLPSFDEIKIDEDLATIQREDLSEEMNRLNHRHYLARNYRVLSKKPGRS